MRRKFSLFCLLALVAPAADAPTAANEFYAEGSVDFHAVVTAPPTEDSIAGQADRELAILFDTSRSPEQAALAGHFEKFSPFTLLADVMGDRCTREALPRTAAFLDKVYAETRPVILGAKANWNRQRPYDYNQDLRPVVDRPATTSYPSGHSFASSLCAVLMSAAFPERSAEWEKEARLVRYSRLYGGAHYPNDVIAGKVLGEAVANTLLRSPKIQKALREVRAEILAKTAAKTG
jgi:acid phosphatase (class A)